MSLANLYRLQQIDSRLDQIRRRIAEIHQELENDQSYRQAAETLEALTHRWKESQKQRLEMEQRVDTLRRKIRESEAALYGGKIRNPKELQDLEREIAMLKRNLETLEEYLLEALIAEEQEGEGIQKARQELERLQATIATHHSLLRGEEELLTQEMRRLEMERDATLQGIASAWLEEYERLRQQKRGVAVSTLNEGSCAVCGTLLTPAQQQQARHSSTLFLCPSCGRILYAG